MKQLLVTLILLAGLSVPAIADTVTECGPCYSDDYAATETFGPDNEALMEPSSPLAAPSIEEDWIGRADPPPAFAEDNPHEDAYGDEPNYAMRDYRSYSLPESEEFDGEDRAAVCIPDSQNAEPGAGEGCLT